MRDSNQTLQPADYHESVPAEPGHSRVYHVGRLRDCGAVSKKSIAYRHSSVDPWETHEIKMIHSSPYTGKIIGLVWHRVLSRRCSSMLPGGLLGSRARALCLASPHRTGTSLLYSYRGYMYAPDS